MAGGRRSRRLSGDAPPATDEEDEIARLQKERADAAEAGPSKPGGEKHEQHTPGKSRTRNPKKMNP